jgi:hypothetical protein
MRFRARRYESGLDAKHAPAVGAFDKSLSMRRRRSRVSKVDVTVVKTAPSHCESAARQEPTRRVGDDHRAFGAPARQAFPRIERMMALLFIVTIGAISTAAAIAAYGGNHGRS